LKICCPEEIAFRAGWLSPEQFDALLANMPRSSYRQYLENIRSEA